MTSVGANRAVWPAVDGGHIAETARGVAAIAPSADTRAGKVDIRPGVPSIWIAAQGFPARVA